jgi:putative FmdB family regulatory protein
MPTYSYLCLGCGRSAHLVRSIEQRNDPAVCHYCALEMRRELDAPMFKIDGRVTPGGGPDRFTADMLGIPLKELPDGLKTKG